MRAWFSICVCVVMNSRGYVGLKQQQSSTAFWMYELLIIFARGLPVGITPPLSCELGQVAFLPSRRHQISEPWPW